MKYRIEVEEAVWDEIGGWFGNKKVTRYEATGHLLDRKGRNLNWFNEGFAVEATAEKAVAVCKQKLEDYYACSQRQPRVVTGEF